MELHRLIDRYISMVFFLFLIVTQASVSKIGQWGGVGGGRFDIEVAPHRLESLIIGSGEVIYSLEFVYSDYIGQQHSTGPWGGYGPRKASYHHKVSLNFNRRYF